MNKEQGNNSVDYCRLLYLPCKQIEVHKMMIDFKVPKYVHIVMYNLLRSLKPEKLKRSTKVESSYSVIHLLLYLSTV